MNSLKLLWERNKYSFTRLPTNTKLKDPQSLDIINDLKTKGYSQINNFFNKDKCESIIKHINDVISTKPESIQWDKTNTDARIIGAENNNKIIYDFHTNQKLLDISNIFYGEHAVHFFTMAARLRFNGENLGSGNGWHRDSYSPQFKVMLYLSDVESSNGPFEYFPNSHSINHMRSLNKFIKQKKLSKRYDHELIDAFSKKFKTSWKQFSAKAGSAIFFDSSGLHRGSPILAGDRYALTIYSMRKRSINDAKYKKFGIRLS